MFETGINQCFLPQMIRVSVALDFSLHNANRRLFRTLFSISSYYNMCFTNEIDCSLNEMNGSVAVDASDVTTIVVPK